jgi:hypothetical protein
MIPWYMRPTEVANLLNPSFCGLLLREFISSYESKKQLGVPYELIFLALPIILHKNTRELLPRTVRTQMHVWLQNHPFIRVEFANRVKELVPFTKESLMFLMHRELIKVESDGLLVVGTGKYGTSLGTGQNELYECVDKARFLGKWFAQAGTSNTIYLMWGIRP